MGVIFQKCPNSLSSTNELDPCLAQYLNLKSGNRVIDFFRELVGDEDFLKVAAGDPYIWLANEYEGASRAEAIQEEIAIERDLRSSEREVGLSQLTPAFRDDFQDVSANVFSREMLSNLLITRMVNQKLLNIRQAFRDFLFDSSVLKPELFSGISFSGSSMTPEQLDISAERAAEHDIEAIHEKLRFSPTERDLDQMPEKVEQVKKDVLNSLIRLLINFKVGRSPRLPVRSGNTV